MMAFKATFVLGCWACGSAFLGWLLWSLAFDIYDHFMQQRKRRVNARFDARVGRDCFRDNYRNWTK